MHEFPQGLKPDLHWVVEHALEMQARLLAQSMSLQQPVLAMHAPEQGLLVPLHMYSHRPMAVSHLPIRPAIIGQSASRQQELAGIHASPHAFVAPVQL